MKIIVPIGEAGSGKSTAAAMVTQLAADRGLQAKEDAFAAPLKHFCASVFGFSKDQLYGASAFREQELPSYRDLAAWKDASYCLGVIGDDFIDECWPEATASFWLHARAALDRWFRDLMAADPWAWGYPKGERVLRRGRGLSARRALQTLGTEWGRTLDSDVWINCLRRRAEKLKADVVVVSDGRFFNEAEKSGGFPLLIKRSAMTPRAAQHASEKDQQTTEMLEFCRRHGAVIANDGDLGDLRQALMESLDGILTT
jgi:hypothetical protein